MVVFALEILYWLSIAIEHIIGFREFKNDKNGRVGIVLNIIISILMIVSLVWICIYGYEYFSFKLGILASNGLALVPCALLYLLGVFLCNVVDNIFCKNCKVVEYKTGREITYQKQMNDDHDEQDFME